MSLDLSEQHQAWQQRIHKEMSAATKFYKLHDYWTGSHYSSHNNRRKNISKKLRPKSICLETPPKQSLSRINVYAEVRGKYARPPPIDSHYRRKSVIVKPSTAGSLQSMHSHRKTASDYGEIKPEAKPLRSLAFEEKTERNKILKNAEKNLEKIEENEATEKIDDPEEGKDIDEGKDEADQEEEIQDTQEVADEGKSWITTSSHRKYIEHLEELLRRETMRRIKAESALKNKKVKI